MGKGFYKQNTDSLNNQLGHVNKRMIYSNKLKNKLEEQKGIPKTTLKLKHVINETNGLQITLI